MFEQQQTLGGVWIHTPINSAETPTAPQTDPQKAAQSRIADSPLFMTAMYDHLETNIPKEFMGYSDLEFPAESQLFPPREEVLEYLELYAREVKHLIRFQTQVIDLRLRASEHDSWQLRARNLGSGQQTCNIYDAVAICSGHYTVPFIPGYPGIREWHARNPIQHSKFYRSPESFRGKKVVVVGSAASGSDIASQISGVCQQPLLLSQRKGVPPTPPQQTKENAPIKLVPGIIEFKWEDDRSLTFADGSIETGVDAVVFATGYLYNFPFIKSPELDLIDDGMRVKHAYQHIFHIDHPTLTLPGLPLKVLPLPLSEAQAAVITGVWSGRLTLPSTTEMRQWERDRLEATGGGRAFHVFDYPRDFEYQRMLALWAAQNGGGKKQPPTFDRRASWARERFPDIKKAFARAGDARKEIRNIEELGFVYKEERDHGL